MTENYTLTLDESANSDDVQTIRDGLTTYNLQFVPDAQYLPLNIFLRDTDGRVVGGLIGNTYWGWLYVSLFWLDESARRDGNGSRMLAMAEQEALRRGCHHAHLDTLDFQAPAFYEKLGYTLWGTLEDLPLGHQRYFYQKELSADHA
jgi:GNAT superfamily N-acetyltransferase